MKKKLGKRIKQRLVTGKEWLALKPYQAFSQYDNYYVKLAEKAAKIVRNQGPDLATYLSSIDELSRFALVLTSYFEDIVNETGIWKAFTDCNQETYGCHIPIFEHHYDKDRYEPGELNLSDLAYLTWHFCNQVKETIYSPEYPVVLRIAKAAFELFDEKIDEAPLTDFYTDFFSFDQNTSFFDLKEKITWLALFSYPMTLEFGDEHVKDVIDSVTNEEKLNGMDPVAYAHEAKNKYIFQKRSSYCALSMPEWFCKILQVQPKEKAEILEIQHKFTGVFRIEGEEKDVYLMSYLPDGPEIRVRKDSFGPGKKNIKPGLGAYLTTVRFRGEWHMTGAIMMIPEGKINFKDVPNLPIPFWLEPAAIQQETKEAVDTMYQGFLDFFGSLIFIPENREHFVQKLTEFFSLQHKTRQSSLPKNKRTPLSPQFIESILSDLPDEDIIATSFTPGEGQYYLPYISEILPLLENYQTLPREEKEDLLFELTREFPPELIRHFITAYSIDELPFPSSQSSWDQLPFIEFWTRYLNPEEFGEKVPNMRLKNSWEGEGD